MAKMRSGFILPMAIMLSGIVAVTIGAYSVHYIVTARVSRSYLGRTDCRLAAQSAIEATKIALVDKIMVSGLGLEISDPTARNYDASWDQIVQQIREEASTNIFARIPTRGCKISIGIRPSADGTNTFLYANAKCRSGGQDVSVTLQEDVDMRITDSSIFFYAYFANSDGHLFSPNITINGDVRSNGKFEIEGATINGRIFATNGVVFTKGNLVSSKDNTVKTEGADKYQAVIANCQNTSVLYSKIDQDKGLARDQIKGYNYGLFPSSRGVANDVTEVWNYDAPKGVAGRKTLEQNMVTELRNRKVVTGDASYLHLPVMGDLELYKQYAQDSGGTLTCENSTSRTNPDRHRLKCWFKKGAEWHVPVYRFARGNSQSDIGQKRYGERNSMGRNPEGSFNSIGGETVYVDGADCYCIRKINNDWKWPSLPQLFGGMSWREFASSEYDLMTYKDSKGNQQSIYRRNNGYYTKNEATGRYSAFTLPRGATPQLVTAAETGYRASTKPYGYLRVMEGVNDVQWVTNTLRKVSVTGGYGVQSTIFDVSDSSLSSVVNSSGAVVLIGTWDCPIEIDKAVYFDSDVLIRGFVTGRGTIYSGRNIHIIGDINYKNPPKWDGENTDYRDKDMLVLIAAGSIVFGNYVEDVLWEEIKRKIRPAVTTYLSRDYTELEPGRQKLSLHSTTNGSVTAAHQVTYGMEQSSVRRYESVIGDWFFQAPDYRCEYAATSLSNDVDHAWYTRFYSRNFNDNNTLTGDKFSKFHYDSAVSVCYFSQYHDRNWGYLRYKNAYRTGFIGPNSSSDRSDDRDEYKKYAAFQSKVLVGCGEWKNWDDLVRGQTFEQIWSSKGSDLWTYCFGYQGSTKKETDGRALAYDTSAGNESRSTARSIQRVDAVLFASEAIMGTLGAFNSPCTVNGAVICHDEMISAEVRQYGKTTSASVPLTINWDPRLNPKSSRAMGADADVDLGDDLGIGNAFFTQEVGVPVTRAWQEIPEDFVPPEAWIKDGEREL